MSRVTYPKVLTEVFETTRKDQVVHDRRTWYRNSTTGKSLD